MSVMRTVHGSQQLLLGLLGSYFLGVDAEIPSRFFVDVMGDFGLSETAARNAVSRVARQGVLDQTRRGRATFYSPTEGTKRRHQRRLKEIVDFGRSSPAWDGRWSVVALSVSEDQRSLRHQARQTLRQLRFGLLYDGVWVSPWPISKAARETLLRLGIDRLTAFGGIDHIQFCPGGDPVGAFELEEIRPLLNDFVREATNILDAAQDGGVPPTAALRLRSELIRDWRNISEIHPILPKELLPTDWPLQKARSLFEACYDSLAERAEERLRHHLRQTAPELVSAVRSLSTAEVARINLEPDDEPLQDLAVS
jgi:phenylacetic acid degradation operon negative regulatory protein